MAVKAILFSFCISEGSHSPWALTLQNVLLFRIKLTLPAKNQKAKEKISNCWWKHTSFLHLWTLESIADNSYCSTHIYIALGQSLLLHRDLRKDLLHYLPRYQGEVERPVVPWVLLEDACDAGWTTQFLSFLIIGTHLCTCWCEHGQGIFWNQSASNSEAWNEVGKCCKLYLISKKEQWL